MGGVEVSIDLSGAAACGIENIVESKVYVNAFVSIHILFSAELPGSCDQVPGKRKSAQVKMGIRWYGLGCREWNQSDRKTLPKQVTLSRNLSMRLRPRALFLENHLRCT